MSSVSKALLQNIHQEIITRFEAIADPAIVAKYQRYFKDTFDGYGIPTETFQTITKELHAKYQTQLGLSGFLKLGDLLLKSGKFEEGSLAMMSLLPFKKDFTVDTFEHISGWFDHGISNWAHVDGFCSEVIYEFFRLKVIDETDLLPWREASSVWKRRAVPVAFIQLLQLKVPASQLLPNIEPLMLEPEEMAQKGVGWFLREAWKRDPKPVEKLLLKWKDKSPRLIFQYATEKMTKEQKDKYRKAKPGK